MADKSEKETGNNQISREAVDWLLKQIIQIPKTWLIISTIFIVLSTFQINKSDKLTFKFEVTNTTAVFLALLWLPSVLKIFALTGGAVKTPAGEITGSSMMPMLQSLTGDTLGFLIEQTKLAEDVAPPQQQLEMRQMRHEWQKEYASRVPASEARQQMERLSQRYKELRNSMPAGAKRTFEMESIAGRMRSLASEVNFSDEEVNQLLKSNDQGKRLLGLSVVEWSADPNYFYTILNIINNSETAFEQTCALRGAGKMVPKLNEQQKKDLMSALVHQRNYNEAEKCWIRPNSNRWSLSDRILSALEA
ncbi:hypothetical protein [Calothrix sp. PCC 7507]|uniref:hypothetical protein n=1 Tax=Calothrix sp. PCC 7507 TaxID=99598 RepID=UPI00029EDF6E|nr:hypothetical protein [Calothrix sp. PCC 7507]AFY32851.1 hypothetical protein Cal7507_2420 [Calothrix sp. PCC 7507]